MQDYIYTRLDNSSYEDTDADIGFWQEIDSLLGELLEARANLGACLLALDSYKRSPFGSRPLVAINLVDAIAKARQAKEDVAAIKRQIAHMRSQRSGL